ncbi:MAG: hypothetical protein HFJ50_01825 [Clostridia bacterium]|jgi:competence protein ComEC|nr:hypothetical protein [Clostridia bacterium]
MKEVEVKNIIIGKQFEENDNYREIIKIAKIKEIKINEVEAGRKINIEKNIYFDILWPNSENKINSNVINNNSLVCKLNYKDFSILFTGDIEEIAERAILSFYEKDSNILKSKVIKVPHHGSKTSSSKEFLSKVNPQIALIGVRKK